MTLRERAHWGVRLTEIAHILAPDPRPAALDLLHGFFEASAARYPHNIAIEVPEWDGRSSRSFTYRDIHKRAKALAAYLRPFVEHETIIAILLPRSDERVFVAQLAVLMAGGAYLCLDMSFPKDRLAFTLEDANPSVVLTEQSLRHLVGGDRQLGPQIIDYDAWYDAADMAFDSERFSPPLISPCQLAYVIYTSGTTGRPKGVLVEHRNVATLLRDNHSYLPLTSDDRVVQNSSTAYDSSIEETYLAFAFGGTLVVGCDDVIRLGPDLGPWLKSENITVFCPPPTLLRTMGGQSASDALPSLKLLYVGGEAVTRDIVEIWAPGRRLENGYGPTECAVTITRTQLHADDLEITIGRVLGENTAWVLDESGSVITDDQPGELCISGASVARGYLGRPELTEQRFPIHPQCGRIYRTGDLVSRRQDGSLRFHGRIDTQVKLRGYRVELAEIEQHLTQLDSIESAACVVRGTGGRQQLIAFVVPARSDDLCLDTVRQHMTTQLPKYMVPARFERLSKMPTTTSGKLDRSALPELAESVERTSPIIKPSTPIEKLISETISERLGLGEHLSVDDDFFEVGGDSLLAAVVVSDLRLHDATSAVAMRDVYEQRTVSRLAQKITQDTHSKRPVVSRQGQPKHPFLVNTLMAAFVMSSGVVASLILFVLAFMGLPLILKQFSIIELLVFLPILFRVFSLFWIGPSLLFAIGLKRMLIGEYKAGEHPVWGGFYLRNWFVTSAVRMIPWGLIRGTEFECKALRLLGAQVGRGVHIHKGVNLLSGGWDLLSIGDNVSLGRDASIRLLDYTEKKMQLGPIDIGAGATLETRAGLSPYSVLEENTYISALSCVPSDTVVPRGQRWHGVPGDTIGVAPDDFSSQPEETRDYTDSQFALRFIGLGLLLNLVSYLPFVLMAWGLVAITGVDSAVVNAVILSPQVVSFDTMLWCFVLVIGGLAVRLGLLAVLARCLGCVRPGTYARNSYTRMAIWYKDGFVDSANQWLSGTLMWPTWLRWAGMKVGRDSEISTIMEVVPELVTIDGQCFFADGIYLGGPQFHRGKFKIDRVRLSQETFIGNHSLIPSGSHLPENILLGVCTVADPSQIKPNTAWFGHPCFELPKREIVQCDRRYTHEPPWYLYLNRWCWELARFVLPLIPMAVLLFWFYVIQMQEQLWSGWRLYCVAIPLASLAVALLLPIGIVALKWILLGRGRAGQHPLWSSWCSRWDFLYVAWGRLARGFMKPFEGTLVINAWLRLFGVRIGRRVFLGSGFAQVVDPDMLNFEDDATVVNLFQAHSFEDRVLKKAPVYIRERATVRQGTVMLYGADIGVNAIVAEQSVIMKNEHLKAGYHYQGAPTRN